MVSKRLETRPAALGSAWAWVAFLAIALIGVLAISSTARAADPWAKRLMGPGTWTPATDLTWAKRLTGYMDARDGMDLKYSVLLPPGDGPFPTIMNYSGYDPGSIGGTAYQAGNTTMDPELDAKLLKAGYAVIGVNMRGTGCSAGDFSLFSEKWGTDGYDAVEWTADQPWSNGKVGMANWSYAGLSQVLTAVNNPPHLKAIAPGMAVTDQWRDVGSPGGVTNWLFPYGWGLFIQQRWNAAKTSAEVEGDTKCIDNIAAHNAGFNAVSPYREGVERPHVDNKPGRTNHVWRQVHKIKAAVISMVVWQDEATGPRAGYYQNRLDPKRSYLVGTNGPHDIYMADRWQAMLIPFFDRYVKGKKNGFEKKPHVRLWFDTKTPDGSSTKSGNLRKSTPGTVLTQKSLPIKVKPLRLSLRSSGSLTTNKPRKPEPASSYDFPTVSPNVNPDYAEPGDTDWQEDPADPNGTVAFTTAPLQRTLTFQGPASVDLWVSATTPDADIQATITEVRPDGKEVYVNRGWLRLSERALDKKLSTPTLPFLKRTKGAVQMLKDSKPVYGRVEIMQFAHIFRKGTSIRVLLDTPSTTGGYGFEGPRDDTKIKVFHGPNRNSKLVLGLMRVGGIKTPKPACDTVLRQPCRENTFSIPTGKGPDGSTAR